MLNIKVFWKFETFFKKRFQEKRCAILKPGTADFQWITAEVGVAIL